MSDEEYARATWVDARIASQPDFHGRNWKYWWILGSGHGPLANTVHDSEAQAWAAAAEVTRERLEQIEMAQWCVAVLESHLAELDGDSRRAAYVAILEREKSSLADLKRGMKPTP